MTSAPDEEEHVAEQRTLHGTEGEIAYRVWPRDDPARVVILAHGYGEHIGRYEHVAAALGARGAVVAGPDHLGHGRSEGERVLVADYEHVIDDLHAVVEAVTAEHPGLPVVLVGHSMGGLIAARYAQRHGDGLAGLVLSGPVLGSWTGHRPAGAGRDPRRAAGPGHALARPRGGRRLRGRRAGVARAVQAHDAGVAGRGAGDGRRRRAAGRPAHAVGARRGGPAGAGRPLARGRGGLGLTNLRELVFPGARHEVFNETNQDEVIGEVADFIDEVTAA